MQRSSRSIAALATALAKAQIELTNPEKSLIGTIEPRRGEGGARVPSDVISSHQAFFSGLAGACKGDPFPDYKTQFDSLNLSQLSYTGWLYYPGFIAQTLMQNLLFIVLVLFLLYPKPEIIKRTPLLPGAIFFVLGYAILLGFVWCLFRLSYRHDMSQLLHTSNPFVGDYAIICLYVVAIAIFIVYFQFDLEKLAKAISLGSQVVVLAGGAALFQSDQLNKLFGTQASVSNVLAMCLLFIFLSALTGALVLRFRAIED
jgi:hypothetical protein